MSTTTYQAVLRGNQLEWSSDAPPHPPPGAAVPVQVTLLDEPTASLPQSQGERMAAALEQIAHAQSLAGLDAAQWQQDTRTDRTLPQREN